MSDQDAFERIVASLYDAMLDDARWPATSALIDEACGLTGNSLAIGEGPTDDRGCPTRLSFVGTYCRGQPCGDWETEYVAAYYPTDERVPRLVQRPLGRLMHMKTHQYTAEELKHSAAYNEVMVPAQFDDSVCVTMEGLEGSYVGWATRNPAAPDGWGASRLALIKRLCPHIRQFGVVRQALVRAGARSTTVTALLDNPRVGVVHLDRRGRVLAANDRARGILRDGDGLSDRDGALHARTPEDRRPFERLVASAMPTSDGVAVGGSMLVRRSSPALPFVVHVKPVSAPQPDYGARYVAALLLIVEPGRQQRIDRDLVAATLGLTPAESRVAVGLAEGTSVREMAEATGHTRGAIRWHLKQIFRKLTVSRQADLVRLVLSIAEPD